MQPDGRVHRYRVQGDKAVRNGWYVLHAHPVLAGAFGSWKPASRKAGAPRREELTQAQRAELQRQFERMRQAREAEQLAVHDRPRRAAKLWALARLADDAHPYLQRKRIGALARQLNGALVVPARDAAGVLHTLQFIGADGGKRFLSGGRIAGCYYAMGRVGNEVLVCEGFATAATVFMATGQATAAAFNCGNLQAVASAARQVPHARIVVCADNDQGTPGNPGLTKATEAARAVGGFVAVPRFEVRHGVETFPIGRKPDRLQRPGSSSWP
jgi:putative DNA primase/helicase